MTPFCIHENMKTSNVFGFLSGYEMWELARNELKDWSSVIWTDRETGM